MRWRLRALLVCTVLSMTAAASAQEAQLQGPLTTQITLLMPEQVARGPRWELTTGIGVLGRATTGTVPSYGYDVGAALAARAGTRFFFEPFAHCNCLPRHGFDLGFLYAAGSTFGTLHDAAWRQHVVDAAYAMQIKLPCLSQGAREVTLTGMAGLTGQWADAGMGDVDRNDTREQNFRTSVSQSYDHFALGWRVGAALDLRIHGFIVGVEANFRDLFGIQTAHARSTLMEAGLRIGYQFQFAPSRNQRNYW